jgi:hypothetical protein
MRAAATRILESLRRLAERPVVLTLVGGMAVASAAGILSSRIPLLAAFGVRRFDPRVRAQILEHALHAVRRVDGSL